MTNPLDPAELTAALDNVHRAEMPGVFAEVRDGLARLLRTFR